jgi:2-keto-4-pentenoate hydratase/2-oxohepta-3-ene-1,7-dioic acid hydratase in catechol pathway
MRILRLEHQGQPRYAAKLDDATALLWSDAPWNGGTATAERVSLTAARLLVPVQPSKIVCVGRNYGAHAKELGNEVPSEPLLFLKPPSALCAPEGAILLPTMSARVEHEAELGLVIGKRLHNASPAEALQAICGITCVNDVTARDLQRKDVQFTRAKGFDTFCPVGPHVETEFGDLASIDVIARVNGAVKQRGNTRDMVFPVPVLVAFMSQVMSLEPGDLISTGTPEGVGPLVAGDVVEIEVSGVGTLRNLVR